VVSHDLEDASMLIGADLWNGRNHIDQPCVGDNSELSEALVPGVGREAIALKIGKMPFRRTRPAHVYAYKDEEFHVIRAEFIEE